MSKNKDSSIDDSSMDDSSRNDSSKDEVNFGNEMIGISNLAEIPETKNKSQKIHVYDRVIKQIKKGKRLLLPPRGKAAKYITWMLVLASFLGAVWSVLPNQMKPSKSVFSLIITILLCIAAETLVVKIPMPKGFPPIPPLLASLLMGLMLRNLPAPGNIGSYIDDETSIILRRLALTVILTRAGLEIDPEAMSKVKWAVVRLAFSPCIVETCLIGVFGYLILGFPFSWSFMLGFLIAAVSPAVVVPSLIILHYAGWGVEKGVPTLVMAASGIDDVLAITGFSVLLGIAIPTTAGIELVTMLQMFFSEKPTSNVSDSQLERSSSYTSTLSPTVTDKLNHTGSSGEVKGANEIGKEIGAVVIEVLIGIASGLLLGLLISYIPSRKARYKSFYRGFLLLSIGIFMVFAAEMWEIGGAGTLCALIMSFTGSLIWKEEKEPLAAAWHFMWIIFQPILFGLTGALVDVTMMDATTVGLGLAVLGIALVGRLTTSTAVTFGLDFNLKEKLFVSISWIPKGTVQAALGSAALEKAIQYNRPDEEVEWGTQILILAVLVTLITAPVGAFGISFAGPRLLVRHDNLFHDPDFEVAETKSDTVSHSYAESEIPNIQSSSSFDSGIIMKPSQLEKACKTEGNLNLSFEEEKTISSAL